MGPLALYMLFGWFMYGYGGQDPQGPKLGVGIHIPVVLNSSNLLGDSHSWDISSVRRRIPKGRFPKIELAGSLAEGIGTVGSTIEVSSSKGLNFSIIVLLVKAIPSVNPSPYENPIRTLGDYSKPSHEGYRNTIELPEGNNVVPLRSDTIWLVQNRCSFHGLRSEDPNQHLKDFLKLVDSLDLDVANRERTCLRLFQFFLRDQASNWLERLPGGSISTWEDLTTRFLAQFFPPRRTTKLRNDIS
ncbi:zinc finger, CCHC-type containing protein [Tanacetum coccineum]